MDLRGLKPVSLQPYRSETQRILLCPSCSRNNEIRTFRYDTFEVEDKLKVVIIPCSQHAKLNLNPSPKLNQIFKSSIHQS